MSQVTEFFKKTIKGGIFLVIPLTVVLLVLTKAHAFLQEFTAPLAAFLPKNILGIDGSFLIAFIALITSCFLGGLLLQHNSVKQRIDHLEVNFLSRIPGYSLIKSTASDTFGDGTNSMQAVMIPDDESHMLGLIIEKNENLCTVFIPSAPNSTSGDIKIFDINRLILIDAKAKDVLLSLSRLGQGSNQWLLDALNGNKKPE